MSEFQSYSEVELLRGVAGQADTELFLDDDGAHLRRSILPGGVRVITEDVPGLRSASVGYWFGVGSRDERPGQEGSTHFLEHLLFKGTARRSAAEIATAFDMIGGESNAATSKEHTSYYARVQASDMPVALDIVTDMVTSSLLDPKEVETERGVIVSELAEAADDPSDLAHETFVKSVFGQDTELGRPVGGTAQAVVDVPRDAVWDHYQRNYASDTLIVAAAGHVNHDQICQQVSEQLAQVGWNTDTQALPRARRSEASQLQKLKPQDMYVERESEQSHVYLGTPGIAIGDERRWPLSVMTTILGGGMSSRLFQSIREQRGLAYTTYAFDLSYADAGAFGIYAGCAKENVDQVLELMSAQWERLASDGVSEQELERARGQLRGSMVLGGEDSLARMGRLGRAEVSTGRLRSMAENLRLLDAVDAEQVRAVAAWLANGPRAQVVVGQR